MALLYLGIVVHRVWRYTTFDDRSPAVAMPEPVGVQEERALYLSAGGGYSTADIEANGSALPSQKFRGFKPSHDYNPQPGDRLCPVTRTKANPQCTWVIGGLEYQFCCPPCIGEFVRLAKESQNQIEAPEAYTQEEAVAAER